MVVKVNGPKGWCLIAFAFVAAAFGVAFLSPWALIPPPPRGLVFLDSLVPLQWWGGGWWLSSVVMLWGAFRQDQSRAMVLFAPMLFIWSVSYGLTVPTVEPGRVQTAFILQTVIFFALFVSCLAVARLVNAPPLDLDELRHRVLDGTGESQEGLGDEH
jgi:hypothetical protein